MLSSRRRVIFSASVLAVLALLVTAWMLVLPVLGAVYVFERCFGI